MQCAKCNAAMKMSDNKKFWFCHTCGYSVAVKEQDLKEASDKYDWTIKDDGTPLEWLSKEELSEFPYLIAHEYDRIRDLLESSQPYGAIMQLKDTYETLAKYSVLLETARIYNKKAKCDKEVIIIKELTEKLLLLSNWEKLMEKIITLDDVDDNIRDVMIDLSEILKSSGQVKFIEWRNRILGHGALGHIESSKYKNEFINMLEHLTNHLKQYAAQYMKINVFIGDCKLTGIKLNDNFKNSPVDCLTTGTDKQNVKTGLFPFLIFKNSDIYFFDSFDSSSKSTDLLSYPIGDKLKIRKKNDECFICSKIAEIHNEYQKEYKKRDLTVKIGEQTGSFEDDVFLAESEKLLLENCSINDSVKVKYMEKWLQSCIKNNKKGVFLFQANAEMGKTISVMQLEGRINNHIGIFATTVKAVYLNDSTNSRIGFILDAIEHSLFEDFEGRNLIRTENKVSLRPGLKGDESRKNMADFLNSTKASLYNAGVCSENLLLVLDGIDELREDGLDILDYIPDAEKLNDGIYILLTSRTNEEISDVKKNKINNLSYTEKLLKVKSSDDNDINNLQREYVLTQLPEASLNLIDTITNYGRGSFLFTHLIIFLLKNKIIELDEISSLNSVEEILVRYFKYLANIYGEKNHDVLFKIVYLLASDNRERDLKSISYQIGESKVSFIAVGVLQDLKAILFAEHKVLNQYRISHRDLGEMLLNTLKSMGEYEKAENEIISAWKNNIEDICYWDSNDLYELYDSEDNEKNYEILNDMLTITNTEFNFLLDFYDHPLINRIDEWKGVLNSNNYIRLLIKLFTGANKYLHTTLGSLYRSILAEKMADYMEDCMRQSEYFTDESEKSTMRLIFIICKAFSDWRKFFTDVCRGDETEDFCKGRSIMHDCYDAIEINYNKLKESFNNTGVNEISQDGYNMAILLEEALVNMAKKFIEFYHELDTDLGNSWQKKLTDINEKSVKRYDTEMLTHMEIELFCEEHKLIRECYKDGKDKDIKEIRKKIEDIKRKLDKYNLIEYEKLTLKKEELYTELVFCYPREVSIINEIPERIMKTANALTELLEKQMMILRKNDEHSISEDKLSEDINCIADYMNYYVVRNMMSKCSGNMNALKLSALANRLFENLNDKMKDYYLLQRVIIVANYVMLLNKYSMTEERNKYIKFYLENEEDIQSTINMRLGKACEIAEHSVWLLKMVIANTQNKDIKEEINEIIKYYFELHINESGEYQARCLRDHYSKPASPGDENSYLVKFNKKYCNTCCENECPAYKGIHRVLLNKKNCKFIE